MRAIRSKTGVIRLMLQTGKPIVIDDNDVCTVNGIRISPAVFDALWGDALLASGQYHIYELSSYGRARTVGQVMETRIDFPISVGRIP